MQIKKQLDDSLRKVYELTEAIKKLEPEIQDGSRAAKLIFTEILYEYKTTFSNARELLAKYIQEERENGIIPITYIKLYREKFGEETNESATN